MPFDPNKQEDCQRWLDAEPDNYDSTEWYADENALALAQATRMTTLCVWTEHILPGSTVWLSGCTKESMSLGIRPSMYKMRTCPWCSNPIQEQPYKEDSNA
jgi:hypothetical protein